jgi:hypothetical protein
MLDKGSVLPAKEIASAGQPAGSAALPEPEPQAETEEDARQWILWGVLLMAAAFLTGITVWIVRSMRK